MWDQQVYISRSKAVFGQGLDDNLGKFDYCFFEDGLSVHIGESCAIVEHLFGHQHPPEFLLWPIGLAVEPDSARSSGIVHGQFFSFTAIRMQMCAEDAFALLLRRLYDHSSCSIAEDDTYRPASGGVVQGK